MTLPAMNNVCILSPLVSVVEPVLCDFIARMLSLLEISLYLWCPTLNYLIVVCRSDSISSLIVILTITPSLSWNQTLSSAVTIDPNL